MTVQRRYRARIPGLQVRPLLTTLFDSLDFILNFVEYFHFVGKLVTLTFRVVLRQPMVYNTRIGVVAIHSSRNPWCKLQRKVMCQ